MTVLANKSYKSILTSSEINTIIQSLQGKNAGVLTTGNSIANVRIATEFDTATHAGTDADPWSPAAIANMIADIPSTGGAGFIPSGVYSVSPQDITKPVTLWGAGTSTKLKANVSAYTPNGGNAAGGSMFRVSATKGVVISSMLLDGTGTDTNNGIGVTGASEAIINRVEANNWLGVLSQRARGFSILQNPSTGPPFNRVILNDCIARSNQFGYVLHRCEFVLSNCLASTSSNSGGAGGSGFYIDGNQASGVMTGCIAEDNADAGLYGLAATRCDIIGNYFTRNATQGIRADAWFHSSIIGNAFDQLTSTSGAGIYLVNANRYVIVKDNLIDATGMQTTGHALYLFNGAKYVSVTGNSVMKGGRAGIGITSGSPSNLIVTDNLVFNNSQGGGTWPGIYMNGVADSVICQNRVWDDQGTQTQGYGIENLNSLGGIIISDNILGGNITRGIKEVGAGTIAKGNRGYNPRGLIASPWNNTLFRCNEPATPVSANPNTASQDYEVVGEGVYLTSSGGTGVSITIKDPNGGTFDTPGATVTRYLIPALFKINFGAFSVAPTTTVTEAT